MKLERSLKRRTIAHRAYVRLAPIAILLIVPLAAHAQGTPFDTGFQALQNLFTGTVAKVASLIAIVIGGYQFAHGEPGAKRALARGWHRYCSPRDERFDMALGLNVMECG